jgi:hypothetical protein
MLVFHSRLLGLYFIQCVGLTALSIVAANWTTSLGSPKMTGVQAPDPTDGLSAGSGITGNLDAPRQHADDLISAGTLRKGGIKSTTDK